MNNMEVDSNDEMDIEIASNILQGTRQLDSEKRELEDYRKTVLADISDKKKQLETQKKNELINLLAIKKNLEAQKKRFEAQKKTELTGISSRKINLDQFKVALEAKAADNSIKRKNFLKLLNDNKKKSRELARKLNQLEKLKKKLLDTISNDRKELENYKKKELAAIEAEKKQLEVDRQFLENKKVEFAAISAERRNLKAFKTELEAKAAANSIRKKDAEKLMNDNIKKSKELAKREQDLNNKLKNLREQHSDDYHTAPLSVQARSRGLAVKNQNNQGRFQQLLAQRKSPKVTKKGLLSSGSYGCVIRPPLEFINNRRNVIFKIDKEYTDKEDDDVGKVFKRSGYWDTKTNYDKEIDELKPISKIDPTYLFTVPFKAASYGYSTINIETSFKPLSKCITYKNEPLYQIILGNAGNDVNKSIEKITFAEFLSIIKQYVEGIITLGNKNIIHQDIKPPNVLLGNKYKADGLKLNIIDFGLSMPLKDAYVVNDNDVLHRENERREPEFYPYYPPDYYMLDYIFSKIYSNQYGNNNKYYDNKQLLNNLLNNVNGNNLIYYLNEFKNTINTNTRSLYHYNNNFYSSYINYLFSHHNIPFIFNIFLNNFNNYIDQIINKINVNNLLNNSAKDILYNHIFTRDIAKKIDIFSSATVIYELYKKVTDKTQASENYVDNMFTGCYNSNSFERASPEELLRFIIDAQSKLVKGGSNFKDYEEDKLIKIKYLKKNIDYSVFESNKDLKAKLKVSPKVSLKVSPKVSPKSKSKSISSLSAASTKSAK